VSIIIENITKNYGKQKALNNVSFAISKAEVVGFLGPNGAGKSTLMKIITCFIPPTLGTIKVCGFDVMEESIEVRKNVGYLPEHNPLYTDMYVKEYLAFIGGLYKLKNIKSKVSEMIEIVGLQDEQKKKIGALSKGYRQRVGLAQSMIHDPKVLILDEPTSGLDPNQLEEIRALVKKIGKQKTVLLSTHIMQEVEAVCDRVIIINKGNIVADDTVDKILINTEKDQSIIVEFDGKISEEIIRNIKGVKQIQNIGGYRWRITSSKDHDLRNFIFKLAVDNNKTVLEMQREEQKLEEVFKELTTSRK
jgi:ABC-2 type transport system ATP-binding protein